MFRCITEYTHGLLCPPDGTPRSLRLDMLFQPILLRSTVELSFGLFYDSYVFIVVVAVDAATSVRLTGAFVPTLMGLLNSLDQALPFHWDISTSIVHPRRDGVTTRGFGLAKRAKPASLPSFNMSFCGDYGVIDGRAVEQTCLGCGMVSFVILFIFRLSSHSWY